MEKLTLNEIILIHKFDYKEEKTILDTLYLWQSITKEEYLKGIQDLSNKAVLKDFMCKAGMFEVKYSLIRGEVGNLKQSINKMFEYRHDHINEYKEEEQELINYVVELIVIKLYLHNQAEEKE